MAELPDSAAKRKRFAAIDQTRGLAVAAMILAHFGPGFYSRIGVDGLLLEILNLIGRFATPTFIAIFGFTIVFAYIPKAKIDPESVRKKLVGRSFTVLLASFIVAVPEMISGIMLSTSWGSSVFLGVLLNIYGVLFFYFLAIMSMTFLILPISRSPFTFSVVLGSMLIFVGTFLGFDAWPSHDPGVLEWFRLVLVSGKYAYLSNFGFALVLICVGSYLNTLRDNDSKLNTTLFTLGFVAILYSLSVGRIIGWRAFSDLFENYGAPPQIWYLSLIAGVMLLVIALFNSIEIPVVSFICEHTGRNPLAIYVAHAMVLPGVKLLTYVFPTAPGVILAVLPMMAFLVYWAYVIAKSAGLKIR